MTKPTGAFDLKEPKIQKEEILVVKDKYFNPKNVAIVTGASSGVGRATAIALGVNGLTVIGTDINEEGGKETTKMAEALGGDQTIGFSRRTKREY
jgi:3-hydroxybutyrate dehydrogenase